VANIGHINLFLRNNMSDNIELTEIADYVPADLFRQRFPHHFRHESSLRWMLRHRGTNGWTKNGVVIEVKNDPSAARGKLLLSPTRYCRLIQQHIQGEY